MTSQEKPSSTSLSQKLESAIATALAVVPVDHKAFETLSLDDLYALTCEYGVNAVAIAPLRDYLNGLAGFLDAINEGAQVPKETQDAHIYAAMLIWRARSLAAADDQGEGVLVHSILDDDIDDTNHVGSTNE